MGVFPDMSQLALTRTIMTNEGPLSAAPVAGPSFVMMVLVRASWLMSGKTMVWARGVSLAGRKVQYLRGVVPCSVCVTYIGSVRITVLCCNIGACMHRIQCNLYTGVWDACGLCYFTQVLPAVA